MHTLNQSSAKKDMLSDTYVTFTALWANSADDKTILFLISSHRIGLDISCRLSPQETICMKYQSLVSGKDKNHISKCRLLIIITQHAKRNGRFCPCSIFPHLYKVIKYSMTTSSKSKMLRSSQRVLTLNIVFSPCVRAYMYYIICINT